MKSKTDYGWWVLKVLGVSMFILLNSHFELFGQADATPKSITIYNTTFKGTSITVNGHSLGQVNKNTKGVFSFNTQGEIVLKAYVWQTPEIQHTFVKHFTVEPGKEYQFALKSSRMEQLVPGSSVTPFAARTIQLKNEEKNSYSQEKKELDSTEAYALIYFINVEKTLKKIYLNDRYIGIIGGQECIKYKMISEGRLGIGLDYNGVSRAAIDISHGNTYYFQVHAGLGEVYSEMGERMIKTPEQVQHTIEVFEHPRAPIILNQKAPESSNKQGTCFFINERGYLLTNYHVVEGTTEMEVFGLYDDPSKALKAQLVAQDIDLDLALLKIPTEDLSLDQIPYVLSQDNVLAGTKSFALGYPLTTAMGNEIKVTDGIINAGSGYRGSLSQYQFSAAIQPGNSGSPLFNSKGEVIGIINSRLSGAENAGYAIKAAYIKTFLDQVENIEFNSTSTELSQQDLVQQVSAFREFIFIIKCH